jgi:hypothetical protein
MNSVGIAGTVLIELFTPIVNQVKWSGPDGLWDSLFRLIILMRNRDTL